MKSCTANVLSVSGGKDSTAMWLWAIEQGIDIRVVFADTGHEHPVTYGYLDYLENKLGPIQRVKADFTKQIEHKREVVQIKWRKDGVSEERIEHALKLLVPTGNPYLDMCLWKGRFPSSKAQFCTEELKIKPIEQQVYRPLIDQGYSINNYQAIRADESRRRSGYSEHEEVLSRFDAFSYWAFRPLLRWTVDDVFAQHKKHGIMPNPLYSQGMRRVGCMPCINTGKEELFEIQRRFPEEIERVAAWEILVSEASKRGESSFFCTTDGKGVNIHEAVEWSMTVRGGRQIDLFKTEPTPTCSSAYGLCEGW